MSNPSLILPQSPAYGEDYVYAAQVEDGAVPLYNVLPLTFTRASGGTRINKDGLVQNMPYNLLQYSEDFTNGVWALSNVTITANAIANPINGQTNAELATCASGSSMSPNIYYQTSFAATNGQVYNYSYYAKKGGSNFAKIRFSGTAFASVTNTPIFNLNTGVVVSGTGTIESVGNGWYRISASATAEANASAVVTIDIPSSTGVWPNGNFTGAESIYIFGAQVNIGSTAQPYLATTDRLNMPRVTYPVGGGCGALLLEKQSTNVATYSEDATQWNAGSNVGSITVTANQTISPDGTQNADKVVFPAVGSPSQYAVLFFPFTASATTYSGTFYLKGNVGGEVVWISFTKDGVNYTQQLCTLTTSWQRFNLTSTLTSGADNFQIGVDTRDSSQSAKPSQTIYVWGRQLEASSYATSYIPTTSTSATRIADACYKTGISNLIGQTEGTIFLDFVLNDNLNSNYINIYNNQKDASAVSVVAMQFNGNTFLAQTFRGNGTFDTIQLSASGYGIGQRMKIAYRYKSGDFALYINGVQKGTSSDTMTFNGIKSEIYLLDPTVYFAYQGAAIYNEFKQFPTALTNAELQALTS